MDRIKGRLDRLKSLSFSHDPARGELFAEAPQLRHLESSRGFESDFRWAQLTYFKGDITDSSELIRILPKLVNVVESHLRGWFREEDDIVAHDIIALPALQKLYLDRMPLPSSLIAPRLTEIRLNSSYLDTLPRVVSRSGCDLQSVTILLPESAAATISFSALLHCPTICNLKMYCAGDISAFFAMLTVQRDSPIPLPKLNDISFILDTDSNSESGFEYLNLETLVAMLKSRWNVAECVRICHVHIEAWWHIKPRFIEGLLSRLLDFDDGELSLWLTDASPLAEPSWGIPVPGSHCLSDIKNHII
jgi:hypothetical protein